MTLITSPVNRIKRHSNFVVDTIISRPTPMFGQDWQHYVAVFESRAQRRFILFTRGLNVPVDDRATIAII